MIAKIYLVPDLETFPTRSSFNHRIQFLVGDIVRKKHELSGKANIDKGINTKEHQDELGRKGSVWAQVELLL